MKPSKQSEFERVLSEECISLPELRSLCFAGCIDGSIRSLCWKLLLAYAPANRSLWSRVERCRCDYQAYIKEFILDPGAEMRQEKNDHPLSSEPTSSWAAYFRDNELLLQIDKDCRRLYPDHNFFRQPTPNPMWKLLNLPCGDTTTMDTLRKRIEFSALQSETLGRNRIGLTSITSSSMGASSRPTTLEAIFNFRGKSQGKSTYAMKPSQDEEFDHLADGEEAHWEVVERILFIYCKVNHAQSYVQGMNEIAGPLYYVFANDTDKEWREHAEADTFFCFVNLMTEIQDSFIKSMDDDRGYGINGRMQKMMLCLREIDYALYARLQELKMQPEFFAFRWITLLLSQELCLPDVLRIWDSLFADNDRFRFLDFVCCAMLVLIRDDLMQADFSEAMRLVQKYPLDDVQKILSKANELSIRTKLQ